MLIFRFLFIALFVIFENLETALQIINFVINNHIQSQMYTKNENEKLTGLE